MDYGTFTNIGIVLIVLSFLSLLLLGCGLFLWSIFSARGVSSRPATTPPLQTEEPKQQKQTPTYQPPPPPDYRVALSDAVRETSMWVIGQPGSGKSRAIESWAMQDILACRGLAVLDPAGDLFDHLLLRMAATYKTHPEYARRLVLIDPTDPKWTVGFNPLEKQSGMSEELQANMFTDILIKVLKFDPNNAPRMFETMNFSFLALLNLNLSIMDLPRLLIDTDYRKEQLQRCTNQDVKLFFEKQYPTSQGAISQWSGPVLNKIRRFVFNPDIRLMLTTKATINFRQLMDNQKILLVNLSKGKIGEDAASMLGAFIVANIQKAALSRADTPHRPRTYLYLDEFQNYTTDNIKDILAESRKYGLSMILAHQYLKQLTDPNLKAAVQNTTGTIISFRIGREDASDIAHELFPLNALTRLERDDKDKELKPKPLGQAELINLLTEQPKAEFWMRQRGKQPIKQRVFNMPDPPQTPEVLAAKQKLIDESMQRYGRLKSEAKQQTKDEQSRRKPDDDYSDFDTRTA